MQNNPTPDEVRASIVPKSDQLNADFAFTVLSDSVRYYVLCSLQIVAELC